MKKIPCAYPFQLIRIYFQSLIWWPSIQFFFLLDYYVHTRIATKIYFQFIRSRDTVRASLARLCPDGLRLLATVISTVLHCSDEKRLRLLATANAGEVEAAKATNDWLLRLQWTVSTVLEQCESRSWPEPCQTGLYSLLLLRYTPPWPCRPLCRSRSTS